MGLVVDTLTRRDLRSVLAIDADSYPEPWSRGLWTKELARSDRIYLAARENAKLIGFAGALLALDDVHLMTIAVAPSHRSRGVGGALLTSVIESAVAAGATSLTLEVRASNVAAQALYRSFGLEVAGVRAGYYEADNEDALVMWVHDIDHPDYIAGLGAGTRGVTA